MLLNRNVVCGLCSDVVILIVNLQHSRCGVEVGTGIVLSVVGRLDPMVDAGCLGVGQIVPTGFASPVSGFHVLRSDCSQQLLIGSRAL